MYHIVSLISRCIFLLKCKNSIPVYPRNFILTSSAAAWISLPDSYLDNAFIFDDTDTAYTCGSRSGDYLEFFNHSVLNIDRQDFSISVWVNTTSAKSNNTVLDKRATNGVGYHVTLYYGVPLIQINDSSFGIANYYPASTVPGALVNDGKWHHIFIYVDRDNASGGHIFGWEKIIIN